LKAQSVAYSVRKVELLTNVFLAGMCVHVFLKSSPAPTLISFYVKEGREKEDLRDVRAIGVGGG